MNILIITHFYEADGIMGSVRWTELAYRLSKKNNVIVVAHKDYERFKEKDSGIKTIYVDNECWYVKRGKKKKTVGIKKTILKDNHTKCGIITKLKRVISISLYSWSMQYTAVKNSRYILRQLQEMNYRPDCVIPTSRPFIDCFEAYYLVKKLKTKWILDQRDMPFNDGESKFSIWTYRKDFHKFDKYVYKYICVSNGMAEVFLEFCEFGAAQKNKTHVITNGYSKRNLLEGESHSEVLTIAYVGDLYEGKRDSKMLFEALSNVLSKCKEKNQAVRIVYAGDCSDSLYSDAEEFHLESIIENRGRVSHSEAINIQKNADVLLLLTWNTPIDRGILPGKFYEYMMANKPIICLTSGNLPNGEAAEMVGSMNLGIAVDYLHYSEGVDKLAEYLSMQLKKKMNNEELLFSPEYEKVRMFDYDEIVKKVEELIY